MPAEDVEMLAEDSWVTYSDGRYTMHVNQEGDNHFFECFDLPTSNHFLFQIPYLKSCKVFYDRVEDDGSTASIVMEARDGEYIDSRGNPEPLPGSALFNTRTLFGFTYIQGYTFTKMLCKVQFANATDVQHYLQIVERIFGPRQQ